MGTLAVRLGVPVIKASKGLAPSSHFPVGFRLPVDSARQGAARHAWRTSSSPGGLLPRGPHQNRTRRFPPSGSSADVAHGDAPQIRTRIRGTGRGYRANNATNLGQGSTTFRISGDMSPDVNAPVMGPFESSHQHGPPLLGRVRGPTCGWRITTQPGNPLRLSSLVILGVVARMFRCATRSSCWCT